MSAGAVRLAPLWSAMVTRLDTTRMRTVLGGAGRVSRIGLPAFTGPESSQWGRLVLVPTTRLWPDEDTRGLTQAVGWLVRVDVNGLDDPGYDPLIPLEAAHVEAYARLQGWDPTKAAAFTSARVTTPVWRQTVPQPVPLWDEEDGVWYLSAEYRCEVTGHFT